MDEQYNGYNSFPSPDDGMTDEERREMAKEVFARMQYHTVKRRMDLRENHFNGYDSRFDRRSRYFERQHERNMYGYNRPMSKEDEKNVNMAASPWIGVLLAIAICAMLQIDILGIYLMAIAAGFYLGVFLRHVIFDDYEPSEAFRKTKKALYIALALAAAGLLDFIGPLFK